MTRVMASIESQSRPKSRSDCFIEVKVETEAESRPACWLSSTKKFSLLGIISVSAADCSAQMKIAAYCSAINSLYTVHKLM